MVDGVRFMAARLVWIADPRTDPMLLSCSHTTRANGWPTRYTHHPHRVGDEWYCQLCDLGTVARVDQALARIGDLRTPR